MTLKPLSRRRILQAASGVAVLGCVGPMMPGRDIARAEEVLDEHVTSLTDPRLRELAAQALETAKSHGAEFADIRVEFERDLRLQVGVAAAEGAPFFRRQATMGIRAVVNGSWGFAGGNGLTLARARTLAALAVERAKAARHRKEQPFEWAPAPPVRDGQWDTPIEIDPFSIPVSEQEDYVRAALQEAHGQKSQHAVIKGIEAHLIWLASDRIFASTEGSYIAQRTYASLPRVTISASPADDDTMHVSVGVDEIRQGACGYEGVANVDLKEECRRAAEEALRLATLPSKSVDVGRYDLVLSAPVAAGLLVRTIGRALELDRARGEKAAGAGTTYAAPPEKMLGTYKLGSQLLTVAGDRSRPGANATVGWDEEGVRPENFALVKEGVVVDYITTRGTAPTLGDWYASQKQPMRSHGCATESGSNHPILQVPNLTLQAGRAESGVDDLIKDVRRGFYVISTAGGSVDQQCLNAQYKGHVVHRIENGRLTGIARDMAFEFNTPQFWRSLDALGGQRSSSLEHVGVGPLSANLSHIGVQSVPARFRRVNVVNTGREA